MKFVLPVLALLLILVSPAFADRSKLPDPAKQWEDSIAKFEAADKKSPPPEKPILFVGSSSIRMWNLEKSWPDRVTLNCGFGGSTLTDVVHFFDRVVVPYKPKAIVVYAGDNDIAKGLTPDEVFEDCQKLIGLVDEKLPGTPVIFIAIKPSVKRWEMWPTMKAANDQIAKFCESRETLWFADIAKPMLRTENGQPNPAWFKADGLHLADEGYAAWKEVIEPLLEAALKP